MSVEASQVPRERQAIHDLTVMTDVAVPVHDSGEGPAWYVNGLHQWEDSAARLGLTVAESTYDYTTVDPNADDGEACGAVQIGRSWYVVELADGALKARHVYDIESNDESEHDMTDQPSSPAPAEHGFLVGLGPDVPCDVVVTRADSGRCRIQCLPHHCEMHATCWTEESAREAFVCDEGRMWLFIVHHLDDRPGPVMVDLSGLREQVSYFWGDPAELDELTVWRYMLDGTCRAVTVQFSEDGGTITVGDAEDGTVYLTSTVTPM